MRTRAIWIGVVLVLGAGGLAVSQALSLERWVDTSRLAAQPALAQETRPPASPVLRSRFGRVVPVGWSAPRLVEEPGRSDQALLTRLGLPRAHAADVALPPVAGLSLVEAPSVGPWPRPIPVAVSVVHYRPALGRSVSPEDCADAKPIQRILASMPDKCDDKLWGRWYCGGNHSHSYNELMILSRTIDENNFERISQKFPAVGNERILTVDREWHPDSLMKGRLFRASCNGVNEYGYKKLTVSDRNADLSDPTGRWTEYFVDSNGLLWLDGYKLRRDGDKKWGEKESGSLYCSREEL